MLAPMACVQAMEKIEQVHQIKLSRQFSIPKIKYKATEGCEK